MRIFRPAERVGMHSAAYKIPRAAEAALTADLINLVIDLYKCKVSASEIISLHWAISLLNRLSINVYPPQRLSRYCVASSGGFRHQCLSVRNLPVCHYCSLSLLCAPSNWKVDKLNQSVLTSSWSIPANVYAVISYNKRIMSVMPGLGRDRVSLLRL